MGKLFSRFFKDNEEGGSGASENTSQPAGAPARPAQGRRRVITAPVISDEDDAPAEKEEILIKARVNELDMSECTFCVNRMLLENYSIWIPDAESADASPLAQKIFQAEGVVSVLIHDAEVIVQRHDYIRDHWKPLAKRIGKIIREHLKSNEPVVDNIFIADLPSEEKIKEKIVSVLNDEINPGIAAHGGFIELLDIKNNTVWISMGGGCQGCAASAITLKQGVHQAFRAAVPELGGIFDRTDHAAGANPFFTNMPGGMM